MKAEGGGKACGACGSGMKGFFSSLIPHPSSLGAGVMVMAACVATGAAWAQAVTDPTRPPAGFDSGMSAADAATDGGGATLQSVLISPTQKAAIISGVMVKLGEKYGDAVLVKVAENEVVLKSGGTQQVLKLHPGVEKREIVPVAQKGSQSRGKAKTGDAPFASGSSKAR